jgi:hypothetical protein
VVNESNAGITSATASEDFMAPRRPLQWRLHLMSLMTGPNFPDPNPLPSPEPAVPPVKEPPDDSPMPRSPVIEPDDPAEPNQI